MKPGAKMIIGDPKAILHAVTKAVNDKLSSIGIDPTSIVSFKEETLVLSINLNKIQNEFTKKKIIEGLTMVGFNLKVEGGVLTIKHADKVKAADDNNLKNYFENPDTYATIFTNAFDMVPENDSLLKLAVSIAKSAPYLSTETDDLPPEPGQRGTMTVSKTLGGQLTVDTQKKKVLQGKGYPYYVDDKDPNPVQGLTTSPYIKDKAGKPLFYATMAPDQYISPGLKLPKEVVDQLIQEYGLSGDDKTINEIRALTYDSFKGAIDGISLILKVKIDDRPKLDKILNKPIKMQIANEHVKAISNKIGAKYAVISIGGERGTEHQGYDISGNPIRSSSNLLGSKEDGVPAVALYDGHPPYIEKHLVVQSDRAINGVNSKIPLFGMDMEQIISFYDETIAQGIPVAVHCTDGIDRTGIMMVGMAMLHEFRNGNDFSQLPEHEKKQEISKIIDNLRESRGYVFLRQEHDILRAVMLGFDLIATQKQLNFQKENIAKASDNELKQLLASSNKNPVDLKQELDNIIPRLSGNDKKIAQDLLKIVADRVSVDNQFMISNFEKASSSRELKGLETFKKPGQSRDELNKKPLYDIETAPISVYNKLINDGFDLSTFVSSRGLSIYHYAVNTFMQQPTLDNLNELGTLLEKGRITAQKLAAEAIKASGYDERIIGMAMQIARDGKPGVDAVKRELSFINSKERAEIVENLKLISKNADPDLKKVFKKIEGALPTASQAKKNDQKSSSKEEQTTKKKKHIGKRIIEKITKSDKGKKASDKKTTVPASAASTTSAPSAPLTWDQKKTKLKQMQDQKISVMKAPSSNFSHQEVSIKSGPYAQKLSVYVVKDKDKLSDRTKELQKSAKVLVDVEAYLKSPEFLENAKAQEYFKQKGGGKDADLEKNKEIAYEIVKNLMLSKDIKEEDFREVFEPLGKYVVRMGDMDITHDENLNPIAPDKQKTISLLSIPGIDLQHSSGILDQRIVEGARQFPNALPVKAFCTFEPGETPGNGKTTLAKTQDFKEEYIKIFDRIFRAALAEGKKELVLPAIGCGAFLDGISNKDEARKLIAEAFAQKAKEYKDKFDGIHVCVVGRDDQKIMALFQSAQVSPDPKINVVNQDIIAYSRQLSEQGKQVCMINAADARMRIGMFYASEMGNIAVEETIGLISNAVECQDAGMNPGVLDRISDLPRIKVAKQKDIKVESSPWTSAKPMPGMQKTFERLKKDVLGVMQSKDGDFVFSNQLRDRIFITLAPSLEKEYEELPSRKRLELAKAIKEAIVSFESSPESKESALKYIDRMIQILEKEIKIGVHREFDELKSLKAMIADMESFSLEQFGATAANPEENVDQLHALISEHSGSIGTVDTSYFEDIEKTAKETQRRQDVSDDRRKSVIFDQPHSSLPPLLKTPVEQLDIILNKLRELREHSTSQVVKIGKAINEIEQIKTGKGTPEEKVQKALQIVEKAGFSEALKEGKPQVVQEKHRSLK
ncbi:MAG: hypothetical protein JSR17_02935 [Proteobacteria bacterium]|nr:hypothetical protein [Pseudomonadota bacterium]